MEFQQQQQKGPFLSQGAKPSTTPRAITPHGGKSEASSSPLERENRTVDLTNRELEALMYLIRAKLHKDQAERIIGGSLQANFPITDAPEERSAVEYKSIVAGIQALDPQFDPEQIRQAIDSSIRRARIREIVASTTKEEKELLSISRRFDLEAGEALPILQNALADIATSGGASTAFDSDWHIQKPGTEYNFELKIPGRLREELLHESVPTTLLQKMLYYADLVPPVLKVKTVDPDRLPLLYQLIDYCEANDIEIAPVANGVGFNNRSFIFKLSHKKS